MYDRPSASANAGGGSDVSCLAPEDWKTRPAPGCGASFLRAVTTALAPQLAASVRR